jgi:hypothetical protein
VTPRSAIQRGELERLEIGVSGLDCKGCSYAAYLAVYKLAGGQNATASFQRGKVVAWVDAKKIDRSRLITALQEKGVSVTR